MLAEVQPEEASQIPYFQDTLQYEKYSQHGKAGCDEFEERVKEGKQIMARGTPYYRDSWQYKAYGSGGHARYKETTAKLREYASDILAVQGNGVDSVARVTTLWQCTASCCTSKGRKFSRKDQFAAHQKRHFSGNAT